MRLRHAAPLVLLLVAFPPVASAQTTGMLVAGDLLVNGAPAPAGAHVSAWIGGAGPFGGDATDEDGTFSFTVPVDDEATPQREGGRAGEIVVFHAYGVEAPLRNVTFAPATVRQVRVDVPLPDLALVGVESPKSEIAEGDAFAVRGQVANAGRAAARAVRVLLSMEGRPLGSALVGDVPAGGSQGFEVAAGSAGMEGTRALFLVVTSTPADPDRASGMTTVTVRVAPDEPPTVVRLAPVPAAPAAGEPVILTLDAADPDGIAHVLFHWQTDATRVVNATTGPPWSAPIGSFPEGTTVRYWATVVDAGPASKATTTAVGSFLARGASADGTSPATTPPTAEPPGARPTPFPLGGALASLLGAALLARHTRR